MIAGTTLMKPPKNVQVSVKLTNFILVVFRCFRGIKLDKMITSVKINVYILTDALGFFNIIFVYFLFHAGCN